MKHKILWMLLALLVVGCSQDDTDKGWYETNLDITLNEEVTLSALSGSDGTEFSLNVNIDGDWSASIEKGSSWGSLSVASQDALSYSRSDDDDNDDDDVVNKSSVNFSGKGVLTVTLDANIDRSDREGTIAIETSEGTDYIYYTQKSYYSSSVENAELLRLVMGETSSDLVVANMPYEGQGIGSVSFSSSGSTALGTTSVYRSSSVEGIYTASGKAYLTFGSAGMFTISNVSLVSSGDLRLQFGAMQLNVDDFLTNEFYIQYAIKSSVDDTTAEVFDLNYTYCGDGADWSLVYADIPYTAGSYLDIIFTVADSEDTGYEVFVDDISIYQERATITPSLSANVSKRYYNYVDVIADLIEVPEGTAVEDVYVSRYYFLWSDEAGYNDGDSTDWAVLEATDTPYAYAEGVFSAKIVDLASSTTYYMRSAVELTDGTNLLSVVREFETHTVPTTTINKTVPTNETLAITASINYDDDMEAGIDERGFYYRLASESAESNIPIVLGADDDFYTLIEGLTSEVEYTIQAYTIVDGVTFSSEEQNVAALPDPLDLYTDDVFWDGYIQYGVESTFVIKVPHNGELESGDVTITVLTELGEGTIPVEPSGTDVDDVVAGGSSLGDVVVDDGSAELYVVETFNLPNDTGVPGYEYISTFAVKGMPTTEGYSSVPVQFARKDVAGNTNYKVAIYDADGGLSLALMKPMEYMTAEGVTGTESTKGDYRSYFEFYELDESGLKSDGYYGENPSQFYYYPSMTRVSESYTQYNGYSGMTWWLQTASGDGYGFEIEGIYKVNDADNPTESLLFDVPLPIGIRDLKDYEMIGTLGMRVTITPTYLGWRTMFSQDNNSYSMASGYYPTVGLTADYTIAAGDYSETETSVCYTTDYTTTKVSNRVFFPAYKEFSSQTTGSVQVRFSSLDSGIEMVPTSSSTVRYGFFRLNLDLVPKIVE